MKYYFSTSIWGGGLYAIIAESATIFPKDTIFNIGNA